MECILSQIIMSGVREENVGDTRCSPFSIFFNRVCTFPLKLTTFSVGLIASNCACLRREAEPITEPSARSLKRRNFLEINTSLVSSLTRLHGSTVPSGSHVGTSFIEWTHMSTCARKKQSEKHRRNDDVHSALTELSSKATSNSFVNNPFPPISDKA